MYRLTLSGGVFLISLTAIADSVNYIEPIRPTNGVKRSEHVGSTFSYCGDNRFQPLRTLRNADNRRDEQARALMAVNQNMTRGYTSQNDVRWMLL